MMTLRPLWLASCCVLFLNGCAHTPSYEPQDPLEPLNRAIYQFNETADRYVLRPVAKGYVAVTPSFMRTGVRNFLRNLVYPVTIVNQYAQGEVIDGSRDLGRFVVNSTIGVAGLIDVAQYWGMPAHVEDFGQTLGTWGIGEGWYLMLPLLGPSTNRDLVGTLLDAPLSPVYHVDNELFIYGYTAVDAVQLRADLLGADDLLYEQDDRYAFVRSAYLQRRKSAIRNGAPDPEDDLDALLDEL